MNRIEQVISKAVKEVMNKQLPSRHCVFSDDELILLKEFISVGKYTKKFLIISTLCGWSVIILSIFTNLPAIDEIALLLKQGLNWP